MVLKGPRRGRPLSASGIDEVLDGARRRTGLQRATCHQLRHTCLTRLREGGMALEAIQAQAGHASIESTRIYLHLGDDWLAGQYRRAAEAIDAQAFPEHPGGVIMDCTQSVECARDGLKMFREHVSDKPVVAVIYTHTHIDHYGGVKGSSTRPTCASGKVPIIAPGTIASFDKFAIG